jgi:hypothetical protein
MNQPGVVATTLQQGCCSGLLVCTMVSPLLMNAKACITTFPIAVPHVPAVEQRMEVPHAATRMGIHSLAHDPMQPYYFATGGEDSLGE